MMKRIFTLLFICLSCFSAIAQISTDESPVSFNLSEETFKDQKIDLKTMPSLDMERIREEDEKDEQEGIPPRFGYPPKLIST